MKSENDQNKTKSGQDNRPDFSTELRLRAHGHRLVCGVDEAGRGPLAGPVVAAAVILEQDNIPSELDDSKKLTEKKREMLFEEIMLKAISVSWASFAAQAIDKHNILRASLMAMQQAVSALAVKADYALIDGNKLPDHLSCPAEALVKGDQRSLSIAAASIVAKVMRDRMMIVADKNWPDYGFARHKGYGTKAHMAALQIKGASPLHRKSFAPVAQVLEQK